MLAASSGGIRRNGHTRAVATSQKRRRRSSSSMGTKDDHGGEDSKNHQHPFSSGRTLRYRTLDYCEYLAQSNAEGGDDVATNSSTMFGPYDKVHLLISMARYVSFPQKCISIDDFF